MDVHSSNGAYFRANVWSWRPVWAITEAIAPDIAEMVTYAGTNDGDGLNAPWTAALAERLREALDDGTVKRLLDEMNAEIAAIPDERCQWCEGTGWRKDERSYELGFDKKHNEYTGKPGWCNGCDGKGSKRPTRAWYGTDLEHFTEWVEFLEEADDFQIW